jgi:hypothetical protein
MRRRASDNVYLHQDFHGALNQALIYLEERFGEAAVREYLLQFARAFYSPLNRELKSQGLSALRAHFEKIYSLEGARIAVESSTEELTLRVARCPAVTHIRAMGLLVSRLFAETTRTVNEAICEGTGYAAELLEYEPESGRSVQRFSRRRP